MLSVFAIQQIGANAVFRRQFVEASPKGLFSEQFLGSSAIFRNQFWNSDPINPTPGVTKISITLLSSGKVRLVNGRILLSQT